jgi:aromatic-L-amino-acid decarboxylase
MKRVEFRQHAHRFSDWMADYLETVEELPVRSQVKPGEVAAQIPDSFPETGEAIETIFRDFTDIVMPGITHWQHPRFFAYFPANSSPPSVLAEMLTATLAAQCMLWETSPAATELEERVTAWLRQLLDLPTEFIGSIQDSASASTLLAVVAACEHATGGRFSREGLAGGPPLVVYTSSEAHSSVEKAARIAGLGAANVRKIPLRVDGGMDPAKLAEAIARDRAELRLPACIVASFGSTGIGAIDPLREIGMIAQEEDIHLHVDAAWAGSALILPEVRETLHGLENVDTFVFNAHKWLFTNFDCALFYMRDPARLASALSLTPTYLESESGETAEFRDWSVALGRRFRALKLWFVLRSYGAIEPRRKLRDHITWTQRLADTVRDEGDFELVTGPRLGLLTFRFTPAGVNEAELDRLNELLLSRVNDSGYLYLTKTRVRGRLVIRFAIGQTYTTLDHVEQGWACVCQIARSIERNGDTHGTSQLIQGPHPP